MWRKLTATLLLIVLIGASYGHALAALPKAMQPFYVYTSSIEKILKFDSGNAVCKGSITPEPSATSTSITVTLMKKSGSSWVNVTSWSDSKAGSNGVSKSGSVKAVKGTTYKVVVTGKVYIGNKVVEEPKAETTPSTY